MNKYYYKLIYNIEIIIEPFCGSSAISYYISQKHPKKFKYILNDNNKMLFDLYNICKNEIEFNNFIDKVNETIKTIKNKEDYLKIINNNDLVSYLIKHKFYSIRPGLYPLNKKMSSISNEYPILHFLRNENVEMFNNDGLDIFNIYKNNKNCLIILDPPYILSNNSFYNNPSLNIYKYVFENNIKNFKSKIYFIVNGNWIMKALFKNFNIIEYDKHYSYYKKEKTKDTHIIVYNH